MYWTATFFCHVWRLSCLNVAVSWTIATPWSNLFTFNPVHIISCTDQPFAVLSWLFSHLNLYKGQTSTRALLYCADFKLRCSAQLAWWIKLSRLNYNVARWRRPVNEYSVYYYNVLDVFCCGTPTHKYCCTKKDQVIQTEVER